MSDIKKAYHTVLGDHFPLEMTITLGDQTLRYRKRAWEITDPESGRIETKGLRYGENPGQEAALYELVGGGLTVGDCQFIAPGGGMVSALAEQDLLQFGKHPSKTNLTDVDAALVILRYLTATPCCVIVKHNNPCGVAKADTIGKAYAKANMADRIAAMGGAVVLNRPVDKATAEAIAPNYVEVVAAPEYEDGAVEVLASRKSLRIVRIPKIAELDAYRDTRWLEFKSLTDGGLVVQQSPVNPIRTRDDFLPAVGKHKGREVRPTREPTDAEYDDLVFGWAVEQGVTSNSVLYVKDGVTVGIGTGEQDRVGVARIAAMKAYIKYADAVCFQRFGIPYYELELEIAAGKRSADQKAAIDQETRDARGGLAGSVMISDAFFPFRDGVDVGIAEGVTSIAHPGGAMRDWESITACNEAAPPVAMVFTGQRAFKH